MQISALKENHDFENRVALTPDSIKLFQRLNLEVLIEDGAGNNFCTPAAFFPVRRRVPVRTLRRVHSFLYERLPVP